MKLVLSQIRHSKSLKHIRRREPGYLHFTKRQEIWNGPVIEKNNLIGSESCWAETVQNKSRDRFSVLFGLIEQDQELAPAMQTQSKEKAERDS